jgi:hypothetical protein
MPLMESMTLGDQTWMFFVFFRDSFEKLALAFANQTLPARQSSNVIVPAIELQR